MGGPEARTSARADLWHRLSADRRHVAVAPQHDGAAATFEPHATWASFVFLLLLSLLPVTVEAVSLHPRDPADVAVFCANAALCGLAPTAMRLAAARDHVGDVDFQEWSQRRRRPAFVGVGSVVLALGSAFYSTSVALGLVATTLVLVLFTG